MLYSMALKPSLAPCLSLRYSCPISLLQPSFSKSAPNARAFLKPPSNRAWVLATTARKPPLRTRQSFSTFWEGCCGRESDAKIKLRESGYCALSDLQTGSITLEMRSKWDKVRGHPAIAQFSGVDRIVDDRYSARVSSCDCSRKSDRLPG